MCLLLNNVMKFSSFIFEIIILLNYFHHSFHCPQAFSCTLHVLSQINVLFKKINFCYMYMRYTGKYIVGGHVRGPSGSTGTHAAQLGIWQSYALVSLREAKPLGLSALRTSCCC